VLNQLIISNYALIERAEIQFQAGLTVITGESGAGKSILLEALGLLLGSRANFGSVRKGEEKCSVEGIFLNPSQTIEQILKENNLDVLKELIVRRELTAMGRSRAFVNDSPVNLQVLKELGRELIDLHGQQENLALQTASYQCQQLDLFAGNRKLFEQYTQQYQAWKRDVQALNELREAATQVRKDQDYFAFQLEEINEVSFDVEAYNDLANELVELENAEDILRSLQSVSSAISGDESGALGAVRQAATEIRSIAKLSTSLTELSERLQSTFVELDDIASEIETVSGRIEINPNRLEMVREQIDAVNKLLHKHGVENLELLKYVKQDYEEKLASIESFDESLTALEKSCKEHHAQAMKTAQALSKTRKNSSTSFDESICKQIAQLGMPKAQFKTEIKPTEELSALGLDQIQMLFDANGGTHLQPMEQVASGGEMARLMLALKSIQSESAEGVTLIFDEIDTGVSGEVAKRIGKLMFELGQKTQVLAVTHLPGVAARGNQHIRIYKEEAGNKMISKLKHLDQNERVEELAGMFSGTSLTEASLESARSLLATS
jgi:DNA repair protein RecN (Recombination protein N)